MHQFLKYAVLSAIFLVSFNSCKNDLELLADYKETMVIYGVLNQDTVGGLKPSYIRVNKAFLGPGNAIEMAKNFDSINYSKNLDVKIERWRNGALINSFTLDTATDIAKDPGFFSAPKQVLYKLNQQLYDDSEYHLIVKNTSSGKIATGKTDLIKTFNISQPQDPKVYPYVNFISTSPFKVEWASGKGGKRFQLMIRFHYYETDNTTSIKTNKQIDWYFGTHKTDNTTGGEELTETFLGHSFYQFVNAYVKPDVNVTRVAGYLDFIITSINDDLNTFYEVNQPSTGIVQDRLQYSNLDGAIGIFSSRFTKGVYNKILNQQSLDSLKDGQYTRHLGF